MSGAVASLGKLLKWGGSAGLICWIGYESLYNSKSLVFAKIGVNVV